MKYLLLASLLTALAIADPSNWKECNKCIKIDGDPVNLICTTVFCVDSTNYLSASVPVENKKANSDTTEQK